MGRSGTGILGDRSVTVRMASEFGAKTAGIQDVIHEMASGGITVSNSYGVFGRSALPGKGEERSSAGITRRTESDRVGTSSTCFCG